jgi:hypothetical protein
VLQGTIQRHPVITAILIGCTLLGAALGFALLGEDWSVLDRILAGTIGGAGVGLLVTATKMID